MNSNFCEGSHLEFKKKSLVKKKKLWKEIRFAICTPIGSYVNEKNKKMPGDTGDFPPLDFHTVTFPQHLTFIRFTVSENGD